MEKLSKTKDTILNFLKENKIIWIVTLIIIAILVGLIVVLAIVKQDEAGNTAGNLDNYGISAYADGWIYYMALEEGKQAGIYRVQDNGNKIERVSLGAYLYINVLNNTIYCLENDEENEVYNIVKFGTDGQNKEILAKKIDVKPITAVGKDIYYFKENKLYKMDLNGENATLVSDRDISYYQILDKTIYFIYESEEGSYIARMKRNGEDFTRIGRLEDKEYIALQVKGNKVYYITLEKTEDYDYIYELYQMNKKGEEIVKICDLPNKLEFINMQKDGVYYAYDESGYDINKIDYKGEKTTTIAEPKELASISISNKWLFYITQDTEYEAIVERITTSGENKETL